MKLALVDPHAPSALRIWRELCERTPPTYFLSPGWIETWLACLPRERGLRLALLSDGGPPIAACFLGQRFKLRRRVVASRAVFLNATGVEKFDELCIEYNGVVGRPIELHALIDALHGQWDEVFLPGVPEAAVADLDHGRRDRRLRVDRRVPAYFVDLAAVRARDYPTLLSAQTRSQLRRARREVGTLTVEVAATIGEARSIYAELVGLHAAQWQAKGQPGAFADPWFDRFHRLLIERRFEHGEIQLVRVRSATGTVGCVYNFVWRGRVLQYQSGLAQFADPHIKPGFIVHAAAVEHSAATGLDVYDLLAGDHRFKKSLSTGVAWLLWARVQRRRWRFALEDRIVAGVRAHRARRAVAAPAG